MDTGWWEQLAEIDWSSTSMGEILMAMARKIRPKSGKLGNKKCHLPNNRILKPHTADSDSYEETKNDEDTKQTAETGETNADNYDTDSKASDCSETGDSDLEGEAYSG